MNNLKYTLLYSLILFGHIAQSQIPVEGLPDIICIRDSIEIQISDEIENAETAYWNFCSGNLTDSPEAENIGNPGGLLNGPSYIDFAQDGDNYFAFVTNHESGTIVKYTYGESLLNEPAGEIYSNTAGILPEHLEGIQVIQDGGSWYVYATGGIGDDSRLIRFDYGSSLSNSDPAVENLGNIGDLDYPLDLTFYYDGDNPIAFVLNSNNNTITRFTFPNGLGGQVIGENLGTFNDVLNSPRGLYALKSDDNWYMFVTNTGTNTLLRLDFGASLSSSPSIEDLGGDELLDNPFDITLKQDCQNYFGFILNQISDEFIKVDFGESLSSTPQFESFGDLGSTSNPHGISDVFRVGDTLYTFIINSADNTISRLSYPTCDKATIPSTTQKKPPKFSYTEEGSYNITLILDEGLPTQKNYCQNIEAYNNPEVFIGNDTIIEMGQTLELGPDTMYSEMNWTPNAQTSQKITVKDPGIYKLTVTDENGCKDTASVEVKIDYGIPNFFTPNGDAKNDTWEIIILRLYPDAIVKVYDRVGRLLHTHEGSDIDAWDGTYNGTPVREGTYWYMIKLDDEQKPETGHLTIIR